MMAAILPLLWWSCADEHGAQNPFENRVDGSELVGVGATIETRAETDPEEGGSDSSDPFDIRTPVYTLSLGSGTILHVSQYTVNQTPFSDDDVTYSYQYIDDYEYDGDDAWTDDNCYNYTPYQQDTPLEWSRIYSLGTYAGGYAMYCMYFPLEDAVLRRNNADGTITYYVQDDQSTVEKLMRSDILGAYQSTYPVFSRIKFRLFHLMTYLRIRLYVPVYRADLNTGYRDGALNYATINNASPHFSFEWGAIRSGVHTAPPVISGLEEDKLKSMLGDEASLSSSIKMYQHPLPAGVTEYPTARIKYKDFLPGNYFDQGLESDYDDVRIYDFSVIIPVQGNKTIIVDGQETSVAFTDTDFLSFYLRTNAGAETRYYFNGSFKGQWPTSDEDKDKRNELSPLQGNYQYLHLYVPRVGNKVVYLGAHVSPWGQKGSEMLLQPSDQTN